LSIAAPRRRTWLLPAGLCLAAAAIAIIAILLLWKHPQTSATTQPFTAAPAAEQAPWKIKGFPAGAIAKIGKDDRARVAKQLGTVEHLVKDVYDTQLMDPKDLPKVLQQSFTNSAAASFEKARIGVPKGAVDVKSTKRQARIGVNIAGARTAAAEVTISVVGELKGETLRLEQHSTLWMQRLETGWRVVGYDVSQGPPEATSPRKASAHSKNHGAKGPSKGARK
jgi:hypothetical protein